MEVTLFFLIFLKWTACKKKKRKTREQAKLRKQSDPWVLFSSQALFLWVFARLIFTRGVDIVNDKKVLLCALISLFFCCCPPHPSPTRQNPTLTTHGSRAELADKSSLIIRPLESSGLSDPPGHPCEGHRWAGHTVGMWTGTGGGGHIGEKGPVASSLSPLLHSFLQECLLANLRQQLWILRHVLFGRCDYFHRKNIFIDKTLSVVRGCFARFFVWFASPWRELCLPPDSWKIHKNDIFVFEENNVCSWRGDYWK